jgi:hypothetical protein
LGRRATIVLDLTPRGRIRGNQETRREVWIRVRSRSTASSHQHRRIRSRFSSLYRPGEYLPFLIPNLRSFLYVSPSRLVAGIQGDLVVRMNMGTVLVSVGLNVYCIAVVVSPSERSMYVYDCSASFSWTVATVQSLNPLAAGPMNSWRRHPGADHLIGQGQESHRI